MTDIRKWLEEQNHRIPSKEVQKLCEEAFQLGLTHTFKEGDWVTLVKSELCWNYRMDIFDGKTVQITGIYTLGTSLAIDFEGREGWSFTIQNHQFRPATAEEIAKAMFKPGDWITIVDSPSTWMKYIGKTYRLDRIEEDCFYTDYPEELGFQTDIYKARKATAEEIEKVSLRLNNWIYVLNGTYEGKVLQITAIDSNFVYTSKGIYPNSNVRLATQEEIMKRHLHISGNTVLVGSSALDIGCVHIRYDDYTPGEIKRCISLLKEVGLNYCDIRGTKVTIGDLLRLQQEL